MRTVYIRKRPNGEYQYTESLYVGWSYFPDSIKTQQEMISFFKKGGHGGMVERYDAPELKFVDALGKLMTNYLVREKNGWIYADINGDSGAIFIDIDFMPAKDQVEFLRSMADANAIKKAEALESDVDRLKHFKLYAEPADLEKLQKKITELKSPEKIKELCEQHAKRYYNSPANVEFVK